MNTTNYLKTSGKIDNILRQKGDHSLCLEIKGNTVAMYGNPFAGITNSSGTLFIKSAGIDRTIHFINDKLISLAKLRETKEIASAEVNIPEDCSKHLLIDFSNASNIKLYYAEAGNAEHFDDCAFEVSNKKVLNEGEQIALYVEFEIERKDNNFKYANLLLVAKNDTTEETPEICITTAVSDISRTFTKKMAQVLIGIDDMPVSLFTCES